MKKWLFMLSVTALSSGVRAMEAIAIGEDDWEEVENDPSKLVKELVENADITKNWQEIDPMEKQIHGALTFSDDYPDVTPTLPIPIPLKSPKANNETLAASRAPSSLSTTHASYASTQSHISYGSSGSEKIKMPSSHRIAKPALPVTATTVKKSSPLAPQHTIAAMSSSSIETSVYEDRGVNLHYDVEGEKYDSDDEQNKKNKSQKRQPESPKPTKPEDITASDFVVGVLAYMVGLGNDK